MKEKLQALKKQHLNPIAIHVGASASFTKLVTEKDIEQFALVSTDVNPLHLDDAYAKQTRFGSRIAHGVLSAAFVSAIIGNKLPGPGAIYLSQSLSFKAPVRIGDTITTSAKVISKKEGKPIFTLETLCTNQDAVTVTQGESVIMYEPNAKRTQNST